MADCGALLMCYTHRYLCNLKNVADEDAKKKKKKKKGKKKKEEEKEKIQNRLIMTEKRIQNRLK